MAIARDLATSGGRARAFDKGTTGEILYASNFGANFFDGWRTSHFGLFTPTPPVGLVSYPTHSSKLALQLSTEMRTFVSGNQGVQCSTFRSISLYTARRYLSYSAFLALGVGGFNQTWSEFGLYFDIQSNDDSVRSFPALSVQSAAAPTYSKARIRDNNKTGHDIPGGAHLWPGDNENKQNFGYLRLTWDMLANGGLGGYSEAQVQTQVFDLTGLGGQSAAEPPQTDTGTGMGNIAEFNGGLNIGLYVVRSTDSAIADQYPATLVADSIIVSAHD